MQCYELTFLPILSLYIRVHFALKMTIFFREKYQAPKIYGPALHASCNCILVNVGQYRWGNSMLRTEIFDKFVTWRSQNWKKTVQSWLRRFRTCFNRLKYNN
jgi:hypothetical protein